MNEKVIKIIQGIVVALLYVGRAVNNKILVASSAIGAQHAAVHASQEDRKSVVRGV